MTLLCPACFAAAAQQKRRIDHHNYRCANCARTAIPGELLLKTSVEQLQDLPRWATRTEADLIILGRSAMTIITFLLVALFPAIAMTVTVLSLLGIAHGSFPCFLVWIVFLLYMLWQAAVPVFGSIQVHTDLDRVIIRIGIGGFSRTIILPRETGVWITRRRFKRSSYLELKWADCRARIAGGFPEDRIGFLQAYLWDQLRHER